MEGNFSHYSLKRIAAIEDIVKEKIFLYTRKRRIKVSEEENRPLVATMDLSVYYGRIPPEADF